MKCCSKIEYDCFYLTKNNINDFIKWVNQFYNVRKYKLLHDDTLVIMADYYNDSNEPNNCDNNNNNDFDDDFEGYENILYFEFDRWYIYRNGSFYDYTNDFFRKLYLIIG